MPPRPRPSIRWPSAARSVAATPGEGFTLGVAGTGAGTYGVVDETIEASIKGGSSVTTIDLGNVSLTADDYSLIHSDAGGVAIAVAAGEGGKTVGSVSIGAAVASNHVTNGVNAFIDGSTVNAAGSISVTAQSALPTGSTAPYRIDALAFGIAGSASATGSGNGSPVDRSAGSAPTTRSTTRSPHTSTIAPIHIPCMPASRLSLTASDDTSVRADSGGYAVAFAASEGGGKFQRWGPRSLRIDQRDRTGQRRFGQGLHQRLDGDRRGRRNDPGDVDDRGQRPRDRRLGGGLGAAGSSSGLSLSLAGAVRAQSTALTQTIEASIKGGSSVTTTGSGNVALTATDSSSIKDDAGGVAIAIAASEGGGSAVSGSMAAAVAHNDETDTVDADIDGSSVTAVGSISAKRNPSRRPVLGALPD